LASGYANNANFTFTVQDSGTIGNPITFSGGWNTSTDSRDGDTWFDGQISTANGIYMSSKNYLTFDHISLTRYYIGFNHSMCNYVTFLNCNCIGNLYGLQNWGAGSSTGTVFSSGLNFSNNSYGICHTCQGIWTCSISSAIKCDSNSTDGFGVSTFSATYYVVLTQDAEISACNNGVNGFAWCCTGAIFNSPLILSYNASKGLYLYYSSRCVFNAPITVNSSNNAINVHAGSGNVFNSGATITGNNNNVMVWFLNLGDTTTFNCDISGNNNGYAVYAAAVNTGNIFNGNITMTNLTGYGMQILETYNLVFNGDVSITKTAGDAYYGIWFQTISKNIVFNGNVTLDGFSQNIFFTGGNMIEGVYFNKTLNVYNSRSTVINNQSYPVDNIYIKRLVVTNITPLASTAIYNTYSKNFVINSANISGYTGYAFYGAYGNIICSNCTVTDVTGLVTFAPSAIFTNTSVQMSNVGAEPNVHKNYYYGGLIQSDSGTRHTASGISWKLSPTSTDRNINYPIKMSVAKIAVNANAPVTVTAWMYRDNAGITGSLVCSGYQLAGIDIDVIGSLIQVNQWEQVSITLNPTAQGVVEIVCLAYGGSAYNVWIDDLGVSQ